MLGRTRLFAAFVDPASLERDRDAVLVKQGMCWPAFFFSVLWALWHRMWLAAALLLAAMVALDALMLLVGADEPTSTIASLGFALFVGLSANDWRAGALERRGMRLAAVVAAPDVDQATRRLYEEGGDRLP